MQFIFQGQEIIPSSNSSTSTSSIFQNMTNGSSSMNLSSNISSQGITQIGVMNPPPRPPINITIGGSGSTNPFNGTDGPDVIDGNNSSNTIYGGSGDDTLKGLGGNDTLTGGYGSDYLIGGAGDDVLTGSIGNSTAGEIDRLKGGAGADLFVLGQSFVFYDQGQDHAVLQDFDSSLDTIQLKGEASDYTLMVSGSNTRIFLEDGSQQELIAIVKGNNALDLNSNSFQYV